jgi:hypothetical protein
MMLWRYCITRFTSKTKEKWVKNWPQTKAKNSTKEKSKQMMEYLNDKQYKPKEDVS